MRPGENEPSELRPPAELALARLKPISRARNRWIRVGSWALLAAGLGLTVVIAYMGTSKDGTLAVVPAIALTASSGLFQVISVVVGKNEGKLDARHVRGMARISLHLQAKVVQSKVLAEQAFQDPEKHDARGTLGLLSVNLSHMEDYMVQSVETWRDLNPEIFEED